MGIARLDRRLGAAVRRSTARRRRGAGTARVLAKALGPTFRLLLAGLLASRGGRRAGAEALVAAELAALAARALRDALGRPRPGPRVDGGFPSRHAAAAVAIAVTIGRSHRRLGAALGAAAALGLAGRVAAGEHEPGDIAAGAALGAAVAAAARRLMTGPIAFRRC